MERYEKALAGLGERVLSRLEGPGGVLAVTETRLVLVQEEGLQSLPLRSIRRVGRGEGGVVVQAEEASLLIPLKAFPLEELKGFLEGLKPHVARARKATTAPPPPPEPPRPVWEEEAPKGPPSVELAPEPAPMPPAPEPTPPPPARPTWEEEAPPPSPARASRGRNPLALPLRLLALLTLGYTLAFLVLRAGADLWTQLGTALFGLTLALTAWSSATSSSSSS